MAATRKISAAAVARAAMAAILAQDKGAIPAPNEHEPRRVTAHLGDFRVEAEFLRGGADTVVMIDRNGAPMLKAHVEPVWKRGSRSDRIDVVDVQGGEWFSDFLEHAPATPKPKQPGKAARKPHRAAAAKARTPGRAKAARRTRKAGSKTRRRARGQRA